MVYKGQKDAIKGPILLFLLFSLSIALLMIFARTNWFAVFVAVILLIPLPMLYSGMILQISIDDEKIIIYRPLSINIIKLKNIAFCMINGLEDNKFLIYAFLKRRKGGVLSIKGIKQNIPYEEIIRRMSDRKSDFDFDINFGKAAKIPVSFVENGEELKDKILSAINAQHERILENCKVKI